MSERRQSRVHFTPDPQKQRPQSPSPREGNISGILTRTRSGSVEKLSDEFLSGLFAKCDINSDGRIIVAELIKTVRSDPQVREVLGLPTQMRQQNLAMLQTFHKMDTDGDKGVDFTEFCNFMRSNFGGASNGLTEGVQKVIAPKDMFLDSQGEYEGEFDSDTSDAEELERDLDKAEEEVAQILQEDMQRELGLLTDPSTTSSRLARNQSIDTDGNLSPRASRLRNTKAGEPEWVHRTEMKGAVAVVAWMDSHSVVVFMMLVTVLALFGEDFKVLALNKSMDEYWSWQTFAILLIFGVEWLLQCAVRKAYIGSLFFWLDFLATVSLVTDISFIANALFGENDNISIAQGLCLGENMLTSGTVQMGDLSDAGQVARSGRAARGATRAVRLIRIVRVLRVLRIFKIFRFFGGFGGPGGEDEEMELRSNPTKIGSRLAEKMSQRVILVVLVLFVGARIEIIKTVGKSESCM